MPPTRPDEAQKPDPEPPTLGRVADATPPEPATEPAVPACEAKVSDVPTALFNETLIIRTPLNVEIVEDTPAFATTFAEFVSACEATVKRMTVMVFNDDPARPLSEFRDEFLQSLAKIGFVSGVLDEPVVARDADLFTPVSYPPNGGQPPVKLLVSVMRRDKNVFVVTYQAHPEEYEALAPTFVESSQTLFVVPVETP